MSEPTPISTRAAALLEQLAELDMMAVEKAHGDLMTAETPADVAEMSRVYARLTRSLRQTVALADKLARDRERDVRWSSGIAGLRKSVDDAGDVANETRAGALHDAAARVAWDEAEDLDAFDVGMEQLAEALDDLMREPGFCQGDLDRQVEALCDSVGFDPDRVRRWRQLPEPDWDLWSAMGQDAEGPASPQPARPDPTAPVADTS